MATTQPNWCNLLTDWWGGGCGQVFAGYANFTLAANLVFGTNPPYQISDFLAIYPKFGTDTQGLVTVAVGALGTGYAVNDVLTIVQPDASGGTITITSVNGSGGITGFTPTTPGTGYSVAVGLLTTGGAGTGATFNVTAITAYTGLVPQAVLQMYINLASASLNQARWLEQWPLGMALFVAHYLTLYLRSEGNPGTTAQQVASSGLALGLTVSEAAGDVSHSMEYPMTGWENWGSWMLTLYGTQLAQLANIVGIGTMYIP